MSSKKLFIHIQKNAGLTVRRNLQKYIEPVTPGKMYSKYYSDLMMATKKQQEHPGVEHARWRDLRIGVLQTYTSFAIIRNPWTRVVSRFLYGVRGMERGRIRKGYCSQDFEEFLEDRNKYNDYEFSWHRVVRGWHDQLGHVTDEQGTIRCHLLRFEHFEDDIRKYLKIPKGEPIKSSNAFHRGNKNPEWSKWDIDYRTLYNDRTIQIVADHHKEDIDTFGFDFDSTAKNHMWIDQQ
jgi:hypothetical protein